MAAATILVAMNGNIDKDIHPFFKRAEGNAADNEAGSVIQESNNGVAASNNRDDGMSGKPHKSKGGDSVDNTIKGKTQKTLKDVFASSNAAFSPAEVTQALDASQEISLGPSIDKPRRKRRRTSEHGFVEVGNDISQCTLDEQLQATPFSESEVTAPTISPQTQYLQEPIPSSQSTPQPKTPPKKLLRLNASGKLISPVTRNNAELNQSAPRLTGAKRRGRQKGLRNPQETSLVVVMVYRRSDDGHDNLGRRIGRIIAGEERIQRDTEPPKQQRTPHKNTKNVKQPHLSFMKKTQPAQEMKKKPRLQKTSAVSPGKLRRQIQQSRPVEATEPAYVVGTALLKDRLMVRHPGAKEPAWPSREQMHVRGLSSKDHEISLSSSHIVSRKKKAANLPFPQNESVLLEFQSRLQPCQAGRLRPDGFREPHPDLHPARRSICSGDVVAQRLLPQLSNTFKESVNSAHPALRHLWEKLPETLTAWDISSGEENQWSQKYAPTSAKKVLQPDREMFVLRNWLENLIVNAVEHTTAVEKKYSKADPKAHKKRRRKANSEDDFIVTNDEEVHDMNELSDPEDRRQASGGHAQKSIVQVVSEGTKQSNAILLSGPNGCGKTAAIYAVAQELNFKVFEISSSDRRSGKDVVEKVGNMTENHLVKHHNTDPPESGHTSTNEESGGIDVAFQRDLASGRQGKMNAFFKPQAQPKKVPPPQTQTIKPKTLAAVQQELRRPAKEQQQSLILLEEVDILFKEDKDFWTTVFKLVISSKRPFVMTCNCEDMVPLQAMSLHAILRFTPPPCDLAADYLLMIAATEGHILKRSAVQALYEHRRSDLRASISELNLWCQMGVGDAKGGLDWIYQRWPPGSDIDEQGRRLRVTSSCTFHHKRALLPSPGLDEQASMLWAWREFVVSPCELLGWAETRSEDWLDESCGIASSDCRRAALDRFATLADHLSAMDTCTTPGLVQTATLDPSLPTLADNVRNHYVEGMVLLQTDERVDHSCLSEKLHIATASLACHAAGMTKNLDLHSRIQSCRFQKLEQKDPDLTRREFSCFDPVATDPDAGYSTGTSLQLTAFDGPMAPLVLDLAPYVRSIAAFDLALDEQREYVTADGKRARTTRASRSAQAGGQRAAARPERWFTKALDLGNVLSTGGRDWPRLVWADSD